MSWLTSLLPMAVLLFMFAVFSSASDMSIISYDKKHQSSWRSDNEVKAMYESWLVEHDKVYKDLGEKETRFQIFKDNLRYIDERNAQNLTYTLGLNGFADLTNEEYRSLYLGTKTHPNSWMPVSNRYAPRAGETLPESVDWRAKGALTGVKNQGRCGSCWAFSTICTVEAVNQINTGKLISLSEQQLVDCSTSNKGCSGGWEDRALKYVVTNGGVDTAKNYPYKGVQGNCNQNAVKVVKIDGYEGVPPRSEASLKKAVANQPVTVAIDAGGRDFQNYKSGIFSGSCGTRINHAVNAVGYGTENGLDYWIVRNSWGTGWGEGGYVRMQRNVGTTTGLCGITSRSYYPVKYGWPKSV